jgi:hypothetical protein
VLQLQRQSSAQKDLPNNTSAYSPARMSPTAATHGCGYDDKRRSVGGHSTAQSSSISAETKAKPSQTPIKAGRHHDKGKAEDIAKCSSSSLPGCGPESFRSSSTGLSPARAHRPGIKKPNWITCNDRQFKDSRHWTQAWLSELERYDWRRRHVKGNVGLHTITAQLRDVGLDSNGGTRGVKQGMVSSRGSMRARGRKLDELIGIGSWIDDTAADISR